MSCNGGGRRENITIAEVGARTKLTPPGGPLLALIESLEMKPPADTSRTMVPYR